MNGTERRSFERSLAARLIAAGKLDDAAFDRVARLQDRNSARLEGLLVKLGLVQERDVAEALAEELSLAIVGPDDFPDSPVLDGKVNEKYLRHNAVLPLMDGGDSVVLAMADPLDLNAIRSVEIASGKRVSPRIALPSDLEAAFARLYEPEKHAANDTAAAVDLGTDEDLLEDVNRLRDLAS